jgi:hypothetical protein
MICAIALVAMTHESESAVRSEALLMVIISFFSEGE